MPPDGVNRRRKRPDRNREPPRRHRKRELLSETMAVLAGLSTPLNRATSSAARSYAVAGRERVTGTRGVRLETGDLRPEAGGRVANGALVRGSRIACSTSPGAGRTAGVAARSVRFHRDGGQLGRTFNNRRRGVCANEGRSFSYDGLSGLGGAGPAWIGGYTC